MTTSPTLTTPAPGVDYPGKTLGVIGLVASILFMFVGLVISLVALNQSKKAGYRNTPAKIGVIVGIVLTVLWVLVYVGTAVVAISYS
ncbi:hypothetical protein N1028_05155 [Herbiconiux sp. CPCC 203407]|jgi:hypothetical protein|uniref:DUF4190 domain-containing protein n=1 Tax=Herbiconiux oxytropis TaxID=2970915 RepID=A0AA41XF29_9MICO|nr:MULTISPECIES: hypothetical protein [Herbiconiux]MCS5724125.1 hypothetical protein [Herbiconiux oxytropis]MCS5725278.1 hypothetical protein [Herbiconiux oxytropis]